MANYNELLEQIRRVQDGEEIPLHELEKIYSNLKDKLHGYRYVIRTVQAENDFIVDEIKRLQNLKKTNDANIQKWRGRVLTLIKEGGETTENGFKVKTATGTFAVSFVKSKKLDESQIPPDFYVESISLVLNDTLLKEAVNNGGINPYIETVTERLTMA